MKTLARAGVAEEVRRRLGTIEATDNRQWGTMTVGEAVVHMREAFLLAMGRRQSEAVAAPLPRPVLKFLALRLPMRWPKGLPTVPGLERKDLVVAGFAGDKAELLQAYEDLLTCTGERAAHPVFGAMTTPDWMRWGYRHTDHHLRQFGR